MTQSAQTLRKKTIVLFKMDRYGFYFDIITTADAIDQNDLSLFKSITS